MLADRALDKHIPEETFAERVDEVRQSPERRDALVQLLPERISLYDGRSANATIRMRGYILAAFEQTGLPDAALPYVLEELENGRHAYLVADAARALRGLDTPTSRVVPFLFKAVENIRYIDDALTFESYKPRWPITNYTTALTEIFRTFGWLGTHAKSVLPDLEAMRKQRRDEFSRPIRAEIENASTVLDLTKASLMIVAVPFPRTRAWWSTLCRKSLIRASPSARSNWRIKRSIP
jgi:protein SCO1